MVERSVDHDSSIFEQDLSDPRLQPGVLVSKGKEDEYSRRSYQRLIQERGKTTIPAVIYDMIREADLDPSRRDAAEEALAIGSWLLIAPGNNRLGIIRSLEEDALSLENDIDEDELERLEALATEDAKRGETCEEGSKLEGLEAEYYSLRRSRYRLRLEIARERAQGWDITDYTDVKDAIAQGTPAETLIDRFPLPIRRVLIICNASLAHDGISRIHIERLVANMADVNAWASPNRERGMGGWFRSRKRKPADDEERA